MQRWRNWLLPPYFEDREQRRSAQLLNILLLALGGLLTVFGLVALFVETSVTIIIVPGLLLVWATRWLVFRSHIQLAAAFFALTAWAIVTAATYAFGGLRGPAYSAFLLIILVTGLIMPIRMWLLFTGLTVLASVVIFGLQIQGLTPAYSETGTLFGFVVRLSIFISATALLYIISRNFYHAIREAQRNEAAIAHTLEYLRETTVSREYLDKIIDSMIDMLIVLGADGRVTRVNQAACDALGMDASYLIGMPFNQIIPPADFENLRIMGEYRTETTYTGSADRLIPVSFSSSAIIDHSGTWQGYVCVAQDITERLQAEADLRRSEELYRTLARHLPRSGVLLLDHNMRLLVAEGRALEEAGYSPEQLEGRILAEIVPPEHYGMIEAYYRRVMAGEAIEFEYEHNNAIYAVSGVPVQRPDGSIFAGILLAQDVTQMKATAEALGNRVEQLTVLQRIEGELHHKLEVNYVLQMALDASMRLSGAKAGIIRLLEDDEVYAMRMLGNYPTESEAAHFRQIGGIIRKVLADKKPLLLSDVSTDPDYVVVVPGMCAQITVPMLARDRVVGVLNLETDRPTAFTEEIFEFVQLLASRIALAVDNAHLYQTSQSQITELQSLYERVSNLEELKTDMIRIAAHDLRNPLNVLTGYLYLLENEMQGMERYVGPMHIAADRMQKITEDILSLQRIEQAADDDLRVPLDLRLLASKCFDEYSGQAEDKQQLYRLYLTDEPIIVHADAPQIEEAISNLISNAIKYTPAGGQISVRIDQEDDRALLAVSDTGYGIPADMQENLFKPFFRAKMQETSQIEGTGLGLHLVRNIIQRHDGAMHVHSVYGEGSTFGFHLPLAEALPEPPGKESHEQESPESRSYQPRPGRAEDARC